MFFSNLPIFVSKKIGEFNNLLLKKIILFVLFFKSHVQRNIDYIDKIK